MSRSFPRLAGRRERMSQISSDATGEDCVMKHATRSAIAVRLVAFSLGAAAIFAAATPLQAAEQHHTVVPADSVKWGPAPPSLPPGAQAAVLLGSPAKEGPFVLLLKFPAGFVVPPHRHSKDEFVTVVAGKF